MDDGISIIFHRDLYPAAAVLNALTRVKSAGFDAFMLSVPQGLMVTVTAPNHAQARGVLIAIETALWEAAAQEADHAAA